MNVSCASAAPIGSRGSASGRELPDLAETAPALRLRTTKAPGRTRDRSKQQHGRANAARGEGVALSRLLLGHHELPHGRAAPQRGRRAGAAGQACCAGGHRSVLRGGLQWHVRRTAARVDRPAPTVQHDARGPAPTGQLRDMGAH